MNKRVSGFQLDMSNGITASVIPMTSQMTLVVGEARFVLTQEKNETPCTISVTLSEGFTAVYLLAVSRVEFDIPRDVIVVAPDANRQACSTCNGTSYCVTNGCVNIGCGWLCDSNYW